jgi:hypothetical protein
MAQFQTKQSTATKALVFLKDATTSAPKTGIAFGAVTVYYTKAGAAPVLKTLAAPDWTELSVANMPGWYTLQFTIGELDTLPVLGFVVSATGVTQFNDLIEIVANLNSDVYYHAQRSHWISEGHWKIDTAANQLVMYAPDGVSVIQRFNLTNRTGLPTATNIFERSPVNAFT